MFAELGDADHRGMSRGVSLGSVLIVYALLCLSACSGNGGSPAGPGGATTNAISTTKSQPSPTSSALPGSMPTGLPKAAGQVTTSNFYGPGPNLGYYNAQNAYACLRNYYVATSGSDGNNGTSPTAPWLTLAHASNQGLPAGSCVNFAPGVYLQSTEAYIGFGGNLASPSGYVTYRCSVMPFSFSGGTLQGEGSGCVIRANAVMTDLIQFQRPYVIFDGFEFDGNNWMSGRGLAFNEDGAGGGHHIWILDSDVHNFGENGIAFNKEDYFYALHDVWHNNAYCSGDATSPPCPEIRGNYGSGLTVWEPEAIDSFGYVPTAADNQWCVTVPTPTCYHIVVAYNVAYSNYNFQGGARDNTDGEGIIFDTWDYFPYTGAGLIMGNVVYGNGGNGIEVLDIPNASQVTIVNNTAFNDGWDSFRSGIARAEFSYKTPNNVTTMNNIAYAVRGSGPLASNSTFFSYGTSGVEDSWNGNLSYSADMVSLQSTYTYPLTGTYRNLDGVNPSFVLAIPGASANNFALQPGSSALGSGTQFPLWPQPVAVDSGACPASVANCP